MKKDYIAIAEYLVAKKATDGEFNDLFEELAYDDSISNEQYFKLYDEMMTIYKWEMRTWKQS